jgi:hypothetical protein
VSSISAAVLQWPSIRSEKHFGLLTEKYIDEAQYQASLVLDHLYALGKMDLEGDVPFEVFKPDDGSDWRIRPNDAIPKPKLPELPPSSLPAHDVLPIYPSFVVIRLSVLVL